MWGILGGLFFKKPKNFVFWFFSLLFFLLFFTKNFEYSKFFVKKFFFFDQLSFYLIFLLFIICFFCYKNFYKYKFFLLIQLMGLTLFFVFVINKIFWFFVFFEISMVFIIFVILKWGKTPERIKASIFMFKYVFLGVLCFLVGFFLLWILNYKNKQEFVFDRFQLNYNKKIYISFSNFYKNFEFKQKIYKQILILLFLLVFFIKLPIYGLHLWLPMAHVEAPSIGSMLLAGLLLKLGVYGVLRIKMLFYKKSLKILWFFFFWWLCFGIIFCGFRCYRQIDIKRMVAYSSM